MTDTAAIRARHVPQMEALPRCRDDRMPWPCDTAIVLAALDEAVGMRNALDGRAKMLTDLLDAAEAREARLLLLAGHAQQMENEVDAAEAREARLRAEVVRFLRIWRGNVTVPDGSALSEDIDRLALTTTPEADA